MGCETMETHVRVCVCAPVTETFLYRAPRALVPEPCVGCRVLVPFHQRPVIGFVLEILAPGETGPAAGKDGPLPLEILDVQEVLDADPLFDRDILPFFEWVAFYYRCPLGRLLQRVLPGGSRIEAFRGAALTEEGQQFLHAGVLDPAGRLFQGLPREAMEILAWTEAHADTHCPWPYESLKPMEAAGLLRVTGMVSGKPLGPLMRKYLTPKSREALSSFLEEEAPSLGERDRVFLTAVLREGGGWASAFEKELPRSGGLVGKWERRGLLDVSRRPVTRDPLGGLITPPPEPLALTPHQEGALAEIRRALERKAFCVTLLHGVPGSGKTEVYYRAALAARDMGRRTLLLLPEIALVALMEGLFRARMGERIATYHSALRPGERFDQWMRIRRGEVDVVIGARSALFAPIPDLGLVVVDEEHDFSYKQDTLPHYQGRDGAVMRGKLQGVPVVLGSGTPSVQSFHNHSRGKYTLVSMPERVACRPLPQIDIVDMRGAKGNRGEDPMFSRTLLAALEETLRGGRQGILFLNRRGYHRVTLCTSCGQSLRCPHCDVSLTHHVDGEQFLCHYCGFSTESLPACPVCKGRLRAYGFGTEKIEEALKASFPGARIARLDADAVARKGKALEILKGFLSHETDILVGTQMLTKGYHFPEVTLVGVVAADLSLALPDFRAGERTFHLLSQVAGRAGRGEAPGRVLIQTFTPDHYAIRTAVTHDTRGFIEQELRLRKHHRYPPFSSLVMVGFRSPDPEGAEPAVRAAGEVFRGRLAGEGPRFDRVEVLGPVPSPISRLKGLHRWQMLVKCPGVGVRQAVLSLLQASVERALRTRGVHLSMDVDPYGML